MDLDSINFNLLKTFYNVAKEGNITKTAEKHFTSQPAVSRAIKNLENIFNTQLFYRTLNGVELTEKGTVLFNAVEEIFENINRTELKIKEGDHFENGRLSIGVPSQIGSIYLFEEISRFHKSYPNIEITIISKTTSEMLKLLKSHEVDFIIDSAPINTTLKNIEIKTLKFYENCFFVNNKFPKREIENIKNLNNLKNYPLILPIPKTANRNALNALLETKNIKFKNVINIHTSEMIISAVKRDAGIGYVLSDLISEDVKNGELEIIKLNEELPKTEVCLVYEKKGLSKIALYFLNKYLNIEI